MAEQQEQFANVFRNMGEQVAGLSTAVGAQGVAKLSVSLRGTVNNLRTGLKVLRNMLF